MVSKITIFEPHFDDAQFGPASLGSEDAETAAMAPDEREMLSSSDDREDSESSGRSRGRMMLGLGFATLFVFLAVALARRGRTDEFENDPEDAVEMTIDHKIPAE